MSERRDFPANMDLHPPEFGEHAKDALGILAFRTNEEVDIAGESWVTMEGNGVATDDDKLNPVRVQ